VCCIAGFSEQNTIEYLQTHPAATSEQQHRICGCRVFTNDFNFKNWAFAHQLNSGDFPIYQNQGEYL